MSHYQNQYGASAQTTDEYGNPIRTQGTMGDYGPGATGVMGTDTVYPAGPGVTDTGIGCGLGGDQAGYGTGGVLGAQHGGYGTGGGVGGDQAGYGTGAVLGAQHGGYGTGGGRGGDQAGYGTGGGLGAQHGGYGTGGGHHGTGPGGGMGGGGQHQRLSGMVEDEIAEGMQGGGDKTGYSSGATTTPGGQAGYIGGEHHEKKGIMEKIKEKLPGHHYH